MLDIVLGDKAKEAKCYNHPDPDWFFIPSNNLYAQKKFCIGCKIIDECLDYAIRNDVSGVWGGTTKQDRERTRKKLGLKPIPISIREAGIGS
jgi:hypothetical protein